MATRQITHLVDDLDGGEAAETLSFGLDGKQFEMDLSERNARKLRQELEPFIKAGRRVGGRRTSVNARTTQVSTKPDLQAVRAWASSHGYQISNRGRVAQTIIDAFHAAGN